MRTKLSISLSLLLIALNPTIAAPIPKVALSVPPEVMIGETFTFKVTFKNQGSTVGFGPFLDVVLDAGGANLKKLCATCDGITFVKAEMVGVTGGPVLLKSFPVSAPNCNPVPTTLLLPPHVFGSSGIQPVTVPAGAQLVTLELPFGSFEPTQPEIVVEVTAKVSGLADDNAALTISARGGFRYGTNALDDAPPDWPILSDLISGNLPPNDQQTNSSIWTAQAKTAPRVMILKKEYLGPEDETATGPNFVRQYKITVDIANNQSISNLKVSDVIPNNMFYTDNVHVTIHGASAAIGLTCLLPPGTDFISSITSSVPGGIKDVNFCKPITGTLAHDDITITFSFYIPEIDANGSPVLSANCKPATSINGIMAEADWTQTPADPCDFGPLHHVVNKEPAAHTLLDKCIAIQKSVAIANDTGASGLTPGDVLRYELNFQISDYRTMGDLEIQDVLSDGQLLSGPPPTLEVTDKFAPAGLSGNFTLNTDMLTKSDSKASCLPITGGTVITFKVSNRMMTLPGAPARYLAGILTGGLASGLPFNFPATGRVVFFATIQDSFSFQQPGDKFVDKDDPLTNCVTISGTIRKNVNPPVIPPVTGITAQDDSKTGISIVTDTIKKTVYAVKRGKKFVCEPSGPACSNFPNPPQEVHPGDEVTFRIEKTVPSSDAEKLTIEDWLPLPIFDVASFSFSNSPCSIPGTNNGCLGPTDTMNQLVSPKPLFSVNLPMNSIKFDYGDFNDPANQPRKIDLLFTSAVTTQPFADGLFLTNEAQECESNTFGVLFCQAAIAQVNLREPNLRIRKGVIATDNLNGEFSQPGPAATSTSTFITAQAPVGATFALNGITGVIDSAGLLTGLLNSNLANVDANDWVTFAIVIENQGGHLAHDVIMTDTIPPCLTNITAINAQWGTGIALPPAWYSVNTIGATFTFSTITNVVLPAAAANGSNIIVITFRAQLVSKITPGCCDNKAELKHYASQSGGPDFVAAGINKPFIDEAKVCVDATLEKSVVATSEPHTAPQISVVPQNSTNLPLVTIGEIVRYRLVVRVPEGGALPGFILTDKLPAGMKFLPGTARLAFVSNGTSAPGITHSFGSAFDVNGNQSTLPTLTLTAAQAFPGTINVGPNCGDDPDFGLGTIQNNDNDPDLEYVVLEFNALVCNVAGNQAGTQPNNEFRLSVGGSQIAISPGLGVLVVEPALKITKTVFPSTIVQSGTAVTYAVTVTNTGTVDAFDVQFSDTLPVGLTLAPGSLVVAGGCASPVINSAPPWVTCSSLPAAGVMTIKYKAIANPPVCPATLTNQASVTWTSLPGNGTPLGVNNTTGSITPGASGAQDGERNGVTPPLLPLNDYAVAASVPLTVNCPPCTQPPAGMVAWWPLNETKGTLVADIAGNTPNNNGTAIPGAINSTGPNSGPGKVDNGFLFCGPPTPRSVSVADKPALNFGTTQNFSIDAWIKTSGTPGFQMIVDKHNWPNPNAGYKFYVDNTNRLKFDIGPGAAFTSAVALTPGTWYHVAVTVDRPKPFVTFYINGSPDQVAGTPTINFNASNTGLALLMGGTHQTQLPLGCKYILDEVEIFNSALAQSEIVRIYNAGASGKCKCLLVTNETITCNPNGTFSYTFTLANLSSSTVSSVSLSSVGGVTVTPGTIPISPPLLSGGSTTVTVTIGGSGATPGANVCLTVGLGGAPPSVDCKAQHCITLPVCAIACCAPPPKQMVSWWPLNDQNGATIVIDIKGGRHGMPFTVTGAQPGKVGGSFLFGNKVTVPDDPSLKLGTSNLSIDAWVGNGPPQFVVGIVDKLDTTAKKGYALYIENGSRKLKFVTGNGTALTTFTSTAPVPTASVWHHVAVTVDRSSKAGVFYIDGAPAGTFTLALAGTVDIGSNSALLLGGSRITFPPNPPTCVCEFSLDEIEIFNDVVSPSAIKAIFEAGSMGKCLY